MLALAALAIAAALPSHGVLVEGTSLGGAHLGDTRAALVARWGNDYGVCRNCRDTTLYWNYRPFEPQGAGATFRRGRAVALFTLWSPPGWRTRKGLTVGDNSALVTDLYNALPQTTCAGYDALTMRARDADTVFYVAGSSVWGFGLMRPGEPVCRELARRG